MVNKTKVARLKEREKIAGLLKNAVLTLCREKYKNLIEVDALICIAVTPTDNHVVKIHENIADFGNSIANPSVSLSDNGNQDICKVSDYWSMGMGPASKKKKRKTTKDNTVLTENRPWESQKNENSRNVSETAANDSGSDLSKNGMSVKKYPYLVQTLCGEDRMYLSTVNKDELGKAGPDKPVPTPAPVERPQQKDQTSVASILSGLMIPMGAAASLPQQPPVQTQSQSLQGATETTVRRKRKLDRGEIRRASPINQTEEENVDSEYTSLKEGKKGDEDNKLESESENEQNKNVDRNPNQDDSEVLPNRMVIKEEPQWDTPEESEPLWPVKSEVDNSSDTERSQTPKESIRQTPTVYSQTQQEDTEDPMAMSVMKIKDEPRDSDAGEMEVDMDDSSSEAKKDLSHNEYNQTPDGNQIQDTTKNSILLKILKGKSLAEAYKTTVAKDKVTSGGESRTTHEIASEDQDSSLVYRLPFVSFQDLFPENVSSQNKDRDDVSVNSPPETSMRVGTTLQSLTPAERANRNFDLLTKSLLEKRNQPKGPYSTRLSSGRKNPVNYTEMADGGSDIDFTDDSASPASELDGSYSPLLETNSSGESKWKGKKNSTTPYSSEYPSYQAVEIENVESDGDMPHKKISSSAPHTQAYSNLMLFACSICGSEFSTRSERDRHEEEEQYSEFVKCPLCNGYFGDEMSKRKHMRERHKVCEKDLKSKTAGIGGDAVSLEIPKLAEGMLTYHTTQCPVCYKFFYSEAERDEHLSKEHNVKPVVQ